MASMVITKTVFVGVVSRDDTATLSPIEAAFMVIGNNYSDEDSSGMTNQPNPLEYRFTTDDGIVRTVSIHENYSPGLKHGRAQK